MSKNQEFYSSKVWKEQRRYIWLKQNCLCALCGRAVYVDKVSNYIEPSKRLKGIVHHIEQLDSINVNNADISLKENNLIGVCIKCHNLIHKPNKTTKEGYTFNERGEFIKVEKGATVKELLDINERYQKAKP